MEIVIILVVIALLVGVGGAFVVTRRRKDGILEPPPVSKDRKRSTTAAPPTKAPAKPDPALLDEGAAETLVPPVVEGEPVVVEPVPGAAIPEAPAEPELVEPEPLVKPRFRDRLGKARGLLSGYVGSITGRTAIDEETWEELEEALIRADVGISTTTKLLDTLRGRVKDEGIADGVALLEALKAELITMLSGFDRELHLADTSPSVWLFVGVNGVGKTTTIGKLARRESEGGKRVLLAAGDTFRAAAAEQLGMWADRSGAEIVRGAEGGDPSAVIFDAIESASSRGADLVLADTAGRLHNKVNLMEELRKVRRVADKGAGTVSEVLLVIDATTGQNGLTQARQFKEAADLTGVVLTKLDGSAKGGIVVAVQAELDIPVKLVGLGEGVEDLVAFDPEEFRGGIVLMKLIKWFVHLTWRLVLLPFKALFAAVGISFKVGTTVASAPVKVGVRATRIAGVSGIVFLILGLVLGLLLAPFSGKDLRAILLSKFGGGAPPSDDELAETVTFELGHVPRTWHLPQPDVYVTSGRAQLRGSVPDDDAREELVKVATAIPGVIGVDDLLEVEAVTA